MGNPLLSLGWKITDWNGRGKGIHHFGVNNKNYIYINIPKNASTWMKDKFNGNNINYIKDPIDDATYVVVLKDPIDRWISGAAQAFVGCSPENPHFFLNIGFNDIFDHIVFDEHTAPQTMFLDNIDHARTVWFNCDNFLSETWNHWAVDKIVPRKQSKWHTDIYNPYNISALGKANQFPGWYDKSKTVVGWTQQQIKDMLTEHLNTCPTHMAHLKEYYKIDYDLIESVKFYDAR